MESRQLDLGLVAGLTVEAFGEPGSRTFRILARSDTGSVSLWLEKEQVVMLGEAVDALLERVPAPGGLDPAMDPPSMQFMGNLDLHTGSMEIGYDRSRDAFTVAVHDLVSDLPLEGIALLASRRHFETIQEEIARIVAASRPRCVLCGTPLTGEGHFCPPSNGHARFHS